MIEQSAPAIEMPADVVIRAQRLGKKYIIGHQSAERVPTLRDAIARTAANFARTAGDMLRGRPIIAGDEVEEFWALTEVSFEVRRGDVVGIIGRNGAGKSTLLKVLSRITEPSEGRIEIRGRVASLLEVGTGFHPELTGRENIYLNGAILGMTRAEIRRKFDEIVAFAEIEKFLDTPVKHFSSGMYVRLAFAVAAHLEPEILIVDEVLAVGDGEFQKKCLGKMQDVAGSGRTVLFVSHSMAAVSSLCGRAILLSGGRITFEGSASATIESYTQGSGENYSLTFKADATRPRITGIKVDRAALRSRNVVVEIQFESPWPLQTPIGGIVLRSPLGEPIWGSNGRFHERHDEAKALTHGVVRCEASNLPLASGQYLLSIWLGDWHTNYDARIDEMRISFGDDRSSIHRPPDSVVGYLDWPCVWRSAEL